MKPRCSPLVLAALAACQTQPHAATPFAAEHALEIPAPLETGQDPAPTYAPFAEHFGLRVGGLVASSIDTSASLGVRGTSAGTEFDFERELGLANHTESFRADVCWRFDRRNRIDVGYFNLRRSAERTLQRDIEWGDVTYPVGTTVSSFLDTRIIPVRYSYSFVATRTVDAGLGAGVYYMDLRTGLSGTASGVSESFSTPVPLPVVSAHFAWEFLPRLQLVGLAQAFYIDLSGSNRIQNLRGCLLDATLGLEYAAHDNFGVGAGVNYFQISADMETQRLDLEFHYDYVALLAYVYLEI